MTNRALSMKQAIEIRERYEKGEGTTSIHRDFSWISLTAVSNVATGKTYKVPQGKQFMLPFKDGDIRKIKR